MRKFYAAIIILAVAGGIIFAVKESELAQRPQNSSFPPEAVQPAPVAQTPQSAAQPGAVKYFVAPLDNIVGRVAKKPFGIYITPQNSPVQPERFTGYHTGADFEVSAAELSVDVKVYAICDGSLLLKKWGTGYGGYAVQSCVLNNQPITVVYGHLRLSSITPNAGDKIKAGQQIALLGTAYSIETDGERRHLHLGVHKGAAIVPAGYAATKTELAQWIDPIPMIQN